MDFNFFEWIREGVKRSVLMGVSDAVETMGAPHDPETTQDKIMAFLKEDADTTPTAARKRISSSTGSSARKLGRSISEIHPTS